MDLRHLPEGLTPAERCDHRRRQVEEVAGVPLDLLATNDDRLGLADEKNCEQMLGTVPLPVGYAGPLRVVFSSEETADVHLPLATSEGALVASVNRGCKALTEAGGVTVASEHKGVTRSLAFKVAAAQQAAFTAFLEQTSAEWRGIGEATSGHLKLLAATVDRHGDTMFITIAGDTDEAMGMNMVTVAAQAIGEWIAEQYKEATFVTVAGNVDSDKKPSLRTKELGRGYAVVATATVPASVIAEILKTSPAAMMETANAKLEAGSAVAGALGRNLHAANMIAALYLATGQDPAHVVEGSLADTLVEPQGDGLRIAVHLPALLVGVRGGGTALPAQKQCLDLLLAPKTALHRSQQLAESIGAAVLAGELSLLAAQAGQQLAKAHQELAR